MNKRRLAGIARWLERGAKEKKGVVRFDMTEAISFVNPNRRFECGTICCIAGAAVSFYGDPKSLPSHYDGVQLSAVENSAAKLLGLDDDTAYKLFFGNLYADRKRASRCIRNLISTGVVDWAGIV